MALTVPADALRAPLENDHPAAAGLLAVAAGVLANAVNHLPALLVATGALGDMTAGMWGWLRGALANLLWLQSMRAEGVQVGVRGYLAITVPVALPAAAAAIAVLTAEQMIGI